MFFGGALESRLARFIFTPIRTATKRASGGKAANNKTAGRRLGPKKGEGEFVEAGQIIWRQRGTKWYPGENAGIGRDHTIFAREPGFVRYYRDPFHAKRRFIGIALGHSERLPTPHFEPRRRRFGYTPIDNEEVAQFELAFLTRKETQRLAERENILADREHRKKSRTWFWGENMKEAGLTEELDPAQRNRLDLIYQYICGGQSNDKAKEIVDDLFKDDLDIDLRTGRITPEEHSARLSAYQEAAAKVDAVVGFSPYRVVTSLKNFDEIEREEIIKKVSDLGSPHLASPEGTPVEVATQIRRILESTLALTESETAKLTAKFLRWPSPVLVTPENKADIEKRIQESEGEIRRVWDAESSSHKHYFIPIRGKLIF